MVRTLTDVRFEHNIVFRNRRAGLALSAEGNISSDSNTFEIGFSDIYGRTEEESRAALAEKNIVIRNNLIDYRDPTKSPVHIGWTDNYSDVTPYHGETSVLRTPVSREAEHFDFTPADEELRDRNIGAIL